MGQSFKGKKRKQTLRLCLLLGIFYHPDVGVPKTQTHVVHCCPVNPGFVKLCKLFFGDSLSIISKGISSPCLTRFTYHHHGARKFEPTRGLAHDQTKSPGSLVS